MYNIIKFSVQTNFQHSAKTQTNAPREHAYKYKQVSHIDKLSFGHVPYQYPTLVPCLAPPSLHLQCNQNRDSMYVNLLNVHHLGVLTHFDFC